jgi:hypothetical protein
MVVLYAGSDLLEKLEGEEWSSELSIAGVGKASA